MPRSQPALVIIWTGDPDDVQVGRHTVNRENSPESERAISWLLSTVLTGVVSHRPIRVRGVVPSPKPRKNHMAVTADRSTAAVVRPFTVELPT